jgi:hypothetical protein
MIYGGQPKILMVPSRSASWVLPHDASNDAAHESGADSASERALQT